MRKCIGVLLLMLASTLVGGTSFASAVAPGATLAARSSALYLVTSQTVGPNPDTTVHEWFLSDGSRSREELFLPNGTVQYDVEQAASVETLGTVQILKVATLTVNYAGLPSTAGAPTPARTWSLG